MTCPLPPPPAQDALLQSDTASPGRLAPSEDLRAKRQQAAEWMQAVLSLPPGSVPCSTDLEFRTALRSGTLLCRALNVVAASSGMKVKGGGRCTALASVQARLRRP